MWVDRNKGKVLVSFIKHNRVPMENKCTSLEGHKLFPYIFNFIIKPNLQIHSKNHNMPILVVKNKQ